VLEAQSVGTPVVTYGNCSHPEVVHHGHTALNDKEFKNYLVDYLMDSQRNTNVSSFIKDEYSVETVANRLLKRLHNL
jgi:glycosyltransferase involved in cell wall biosynthesis